MYWQVEAHAHVLVGGRVRTRTGGWKGAHTYWWVEACKCTGGWKRANALVGGSAQGAALHG